MQKEKERMLPHERTADRLPSVVVVAVLGHTIDECRVHVVFMVGLKMKRYNDLLAVELVMTSILYY